jgi:hypothetical protein
MYTSIALRRTGTKTLYISLLADPHEDSTKALVIEHKFKTKHNFEEVKWLIHQLEEFLEGAK